MYPEGLLYTEEHEWVRTEDGELTIGITAFAAEQLGEVTYVELPDVGTQLEVGGEAATVESVKAASDIFSPVSGEVSKINGALEDNPELVNDSPYDEGWFFKITNVDTAGLDSLMNAQAYAAFVEDQAH